MNEIVKKILLAGTYLRQFGFTCSAVDHLQKAKKEYKNL